MTVAQRGDTPAIGLALKEKPPAPRPAAAPGPGRAAGPRAAAAGPAAKGAAAKGAAAKGAAAKGASGCGMVDGYDCQELMTCDILTEDGTSNGTCGGTCLDADSSGFEARPSIVWIGPAAEQPSCADALLDGGRGGETALVDYERLVAEPNRELRCDPCACTEPACVLPGGLTVTSGWMCDESPGETVTSFRAPPGWDGACVAPRRGGARGVRLVRGRSRHRAPLRGRAGRGAARRCSAG
ncbi:uncharacterized protein SOCEGT47_006050 [Sorangium cellulosum]|uniref:Uncharacterized protein n=1 Tax=Sorangium cellulosum TaxID=56 RepID=A0A4P2PUH2_SORCE|nr:hypothetical protein [Sorangium cellulosum]AUX20141.1 uncharacterized protein SOCEGT47_006050 [Sorangium cellulosum]